MTEPRPFTAADAAKNLRAATRSDDKYSRGVVGLHTGSATYPGAAVLGVEGAWRAGAGMVRYAGPVREPVLQRRPETVTGAGRSGAWVVGSGMVATDPHTAEAVAELLAGLTPVVVDAGALPLVAQHSAPLVLTPHAGECAALFRQHGIAGDPSPSTAMQLAVMLDAVIVLKGATTTIVEPGGTITSVESETSWLSTAGTGDVLAGAIGSVIAQRGASTLAALASCAATAVFLHSRAGFMAASRGSAVPHPIVAMDVAEALPFAIAELLGMENGE